MPTSWMVLLLYMIGLALGAYGLTMALLQIPFGMLSDRIGRKPVLEATLPSLVSRVAPVDGKGTAMGVYSTSQFLGAFVGGAGGGVLLGLLV